MIRTKHLVLALGVSAFSAIAAGVFLNGGAGYPLVLTAAFSLPQDAYEVVSEERRSLDEHRSALIASVREALRTDPVPEPEPEPMPAPLPPEPEAITVSVPPGHGAPGYGDAPATITPSAPTPGRETLTPAASSSEAQAVPSSTSTQPDGVPVSGAGVQ